LAWSCAYNNRVHLGYCSYSNTPNTILVFDLDAKGWTVLQTTPGIASMILLDAPTDPSPYVAVVGSSTSGQTYVWDYVPSSTIQSALDDGVPIQAACLSKLFWIGDPGTTKAIQRVYPSLFISGSLHANFTLSVDYANPVVTGIVDTVNLTSNALIWMVGYWGQGYWGGVTGFVLYGPPYSRIDFPGTQGDTFAFGISTAQASPPWIFIGCSGVYSQRGLT
jgi:hypothetical protein